MLPRSAADQYEIQQGISTTTAATASALWRRMGDDFDESWSRIRPQMLDVLEAGRRAAVAQAIPYIGDVLAETGQSGPAEGFLSAGAFLSTAPDGRDMGSLLDLSVIRAKESVGAGVRPEEALRISGRWLTKTTLTTLADTRRDVYQADIIQRPEVTGFVRMLNPPSCNRCIILAGKWYRWNDGFKRHPRCDCQHIPSAENASGDFRTDPYAMFRSMTPEQQEKVFGRSEARALREGADIYKVVNQSARKLRTANSVIDQIYREAGTRTRAIQALKDRGFILERGQVLVSRSPGVLTDAQVLAKGRGRGTVTVGGRAVTTGRAARFDAVQSGRRDPLARATMTAAERRLYDAHYRLDFALRNGTAPRGVGLSTADVHAQPIPLTPRALAELRRAYEQELGRLSTNSAGGIQRLADALGIQIRPDGAVSPLTPPAGRTRRRVAGSGS